MRILLQNNPVSFFGEIKILDTSFAIHPGLNAHHFKQVQEVVDFFSTLNPKDNNRVVFLSDYELLRQAKNGLQIIEESEIKNTTLATSYYTNPSIRDKAIELEVKILPKQIASIVPIFLEQSRPPYESYIARFRRFLMS